MARVREFIVKLVSRCNLNCSYCYVYNLGDTGWMNQPRFMSPQVLRRAARRIGEYARKHNLDEVRVIFHGGEALMAGPVRLRQAAEIMREHVPNLQLSAQTNATLLTDAIMDVLEEFEFGIGVSLDGDEEAHNRHRVYAHGGGSYAQVVAGIEQLRRRGLPFAFLAVVDLRNDPIVTFQALAQFGPDSMDYLWPLGTRDKLPDGHRDNTFWTETIYWDKPPATREYRSYIGPYGHWSTDLFDHWSRLTDAPDIRMFEIIMNQLLGGNMKVQFVGLPSDSSIVIQTDGTYELVDSLMSVYDGAAVTGLNVFGHSIDVVARHPGIVPPTPAMTCQKCQFFRQCGGGYFPQRYSEANGFDNPSLYCPDLMWLIQHIQWALVRNTNKLLCARLPV